MTMCPHGRPFGGYSCPLCQVDKKMAHLERMRRWPNLLRDVVCGWSAPPGWNALLEKLCDLLERIGNVECVQCKEKFGGLRFYLDAEPPRMDLMQAAGTLHLRRPARSLAQQLIDAAEAASFYICQDCGGDGRLVQSRGWWRTRCEACERKDKENG